MPVPLPSILLRAGAALVLALASALAAPARGQGLRVEAVASGLAHPWGLAFLPGGRFLVTERPGRLRVVEADGRLGPPLDGVVPVHARGQGGLLDVALDRDFARNRLLYLCFAEADGAANGTALARARLSGDDRALEAVRVIWRQQPKVRSDLHFGCRIAQGRDGLLFLAVGERFVRMDDAQRLDNHLGKVLRLTRDGQAAPGNPLAGRAGALPEIWTYGHRNPQGLAFTPGGALWLHEHGPQGGDEVNLLQPGRNYGWPVITHGEQYGGGPIGAGQSAQPGMEPPLHHWTLSIAPSGMAFVTSERYGPDLQGDLLLGSLKFRTLVRLQLQGGRVAGEQRLDIVGERVRDVRQGPDGWIYLLTDSPQGRLLRLRPAP